MVKRVQMSKNLAKEITSWKYEDECGIYNLPSWEQMKINNYALCDDTLRKELYNAYLNSNDELIGFTRIDNFPTDIVIGIGVKPNKCGKGIGEEILKMTIDMCKMKYGDKPIKLQVATWNQRAINCYRNVGFTSIKTYIDEDLELIEMEYL